VSHTYLDEPHSAVVATLRLLRHFQAFLRSTCHEMRDPIAGYGFYLTKPEARHKLTWLINVAINRKAGLAGRPFRKHEPDYQRGLRQDATRLNHPRLRIYSLTTPELRARFAHRLIPPDDSA